MYVRMSVMWCCWSQRPPHDGLSGLVGVVELLVPVGQQGVALAHRLADQGRVLGAEEPGLSAGGVQVGVRPEERLVRPRLVPAHQQLGARGLEEAADVSCGTESSALRARSVSRSKTPDLLITSLFYAAAFTLGPSAVTMATAPAASLRVPMTTLTNGVQSKYVQTELNRSLPSGQMLSISKHLIALFLAAYTGSFNTATTLTPTERDAHQTQAQTHGDGDLQMVPLRSIISCPHSTFTHTQKHSVTLQVL